MFRNYLKTAWRNFLRNRQFSILNLLGLSTGLACALLIYLWVATEIKVDKFNAQDDRLFQILMNVQSEKGIETVEWTPGLLASSLTNEIPDVEYASSVIPVSWFDKPAILTYEDKHISVSSQFAGKDYFKVFPFNLIEGTTEQVLRDKNSIVVSKDVAQKMFGQSQNVVGKTITLNREDYNNDYIVSGIFELPENLTSKFDVVLNYSLFIDKNKKLENWGNNDPFTYVRLKANASTVAFANKISSFVKLKKPDSKAILIAQNYSDRYLYNRFENGNVAGGRIEYVKLFSIIALFILIIACINFMNLATAKAATRMKEVGVKKVMGAARLSLVIQFLVEAFLMTCLSVLVAVAIVLLLLPAFNKFTASPITLHFGWPLFIAGFAFAVFTALLAGSYPALYLSGFKPVDVLKGRLKISLNELWIRKGLTVFQFAISTVFIIAVLIVYAQMRLIQTKNLGYNRDNIIYFEKGETISTNKDYYAPGGQFETELNYFVQQVKKIPGVINAANFRHNITNRNGGTSDISWKGKPENLNVQITDLSVGYNFIETLGIEMLEGRTFSKSYADEKSKIIFNEAAIQTMGLKNPVGQTIRLWGEDRQIIGIAKNFNFQSLHENLKPCFFDLTTNKRASKIIVRLKPGQEKQTIARLEEFNKSVNHNQPFEYRLLDDDYQSLYASEKKVETLSKYFAGLAIIISCLGLFGLAAFSAQRRQKEISVRKVVGATVSDILSILLKDFLKPIGVALLIAFPIAFLVMNQWLNGFAYRIDSTYNLFLAGGALILIVALLTVGYQSIRAAVNSPAKALRAE